MTQGSAAPERPRRRAVLDALRAADEPLGVTEVAGRLGIHVNTARFHLDALVTEGAVERTLAAPSGPGRPRTVHAPRAGMHRDGVRSYHLLSRVLLSHLSAGPEGSEAAREAGLAWGRYLVDGPSPLQHLTEEEAVTRLTALLADLGFDPAPGPFRGESGTPESISVRHCPFLELVEEQGPIVCRVHLGLMQGALTELRAPLTVSGLEPFVEPDVCLAPLERSGTG